MQLRADFLSCLAFWSRLPVSGQDELPEFRVAVRALPIAALAIAAPAAAMALARAFGAPSLVAALLAVAVLVVTTGALHEDGLADCADAASGSTPESRLAIMKDSRIGAYGTLALIFSIGARAAALAALAHSSLALACAGLFAAAALSRMAALTPLTLLAPARETGLGQSAGAPEAGALGMATTLSLVCAVLPVIADAPMLRVALASLSTIGAGFVVSSIARAKLGGQTGDVAGAAQQLAEIAYLVILSAGSGI